MARKANNPAMRAAVQAWLRHKGISPNDVLNDFTVKHESGQTFITFTMWAQDFPLTTPAPDTKEFLVDARGHVWRYDPSLDGYRLFPWGVIRTMEYIRDRYGLEGAPQPEPDQARTEVSRETNLFPSNAINRPHPTCIDITTSSERPYSSWVCGPDCPTSGDE